MAVPRNAGLYGPAVGYGHLEARFEPDSGKTWSALDLVCSSCGAAVDVPCTGPRICPDRMAAARELINSGKLDARGTAEHCAVPEELRSPDTVPARPFNISLTRPPKRGAHPKLTPLQKAEVARRYRAGGISKAELGRQYGVSQSTIAHVISKG
jgi:hypothetical protein